MPQTLHAELARVAEREGVSLNTLITGALASAVSWREGTLEGLDVADAESEHGTPPARRRPRWTSIALAANLVVVVLAAIVAIVLLVIALGHGW